MIKVEEYYMGLYVQTREFASLKHVELFVQNAGKEPGVEYVILD